MKSNKVKNFKLRLIFAKKELLIRLNKFLKINLLNTFFLKKNANLLICNLILKKKVSKVTVKNKCVLTGCNNSVNKEYNISRVKFRKLLQFGIVSNYNKAVW
jgi:ribosomal protein S14